MNDRPAPQIKTAAKNAQSPVPVVCTTKVPTLARAVRGRTHISPTIETYGLFQVAYDFFDEQLFGGRLPPCLIMRSWARASAAMNATMFSSGAAFGSGENLSFASMPADQLLAAPTLLSKTSGRNSASNSSSARGLSSGRSSSRQYARGRARTDARASTEGASTAESENEAFVTRYEDLPTQMFSLEEQLHRLTGEIMTLQRRECFVKLEGQAPFRARTADVQPAFRSIEFRSEMLPRYLATIAHRSAYLVPAAQVDAEIAARLLAITTAPSQPDPDFTAPEPIPNVVDAPQRYARDFWNRQHQKPDEPPGRPALAALGEKHKHLRVVDGKKDDGDKSP